MWQVHKETYKPIANLKQEHKLGNHPKLIIQILELDPYKIQPQSLNISGSVAKFILYFNNSLVVVCLKFDVHFWPKVAFIQ